ncbi:MAG: dihydroorotate dehydrogenase [Tissierellia bacterium]|nr:dihydroorotate dehydrogenase [Tissierellia bacterium]
MEVKFLGQSLKNPLMGASGCYGYGVEFSRFYDPSILGAICSKGLTLNPHGGNEGIRIWETPSGVMNSIGLENPGVEAFLQEKLPQMRALDTTIVVNLGGHSEEQYEEGARLLNEGDLDILELNISCPNLKEGGMAFGSTAKKAAEMTERVKKITRFPLMVKLSPNGEDVAEVARAVEAAGADAVSLVNTFQAMAIDVRAKKPVFNNLYAGLSGPAIFPIALRMVHQVARAVQIPVVGIGGIQSAEEVIAMILAGATAVEVGTQNLSDPGAIPKILRDLEAYLEEEQCSWEDLRGLI